MPTIGEDGQEVARPQRAERRGGRGNKFEGKAREDAHPMDRQDGTGRGRRGDKKGGHGKANWGKDGEVVEESKEEKPARERKPREEPKPEPVVEEEVGFTLDDYMAAKQAKTQGLAVKKDVRQHEKLDAKNIKDLDYKHDEMATTKLVKQPEVMATRPNAGANLFGFQAVEDDVDRSVRGGRGGRGDRPVRNERPQTQKGGRKGGKIIVDDNDFPAL